MEADAWSEWTAQRAPGRGWLPGADERYRALSEQIPAVLYSEVQTPAGSVVYKSPQNQRLLGYTTEEPCGRTSGRR
jgi:hypothetical protein